MDNKKIFVVITVVVVTLCTIVGTYYNNQYTVLQNELHSTQKNIQAITEKNVKMSKELESASDTIKGLKKECDMLEDMKKQEHKLIYIGEYKVSHYCVEKYKHICGTGGGKTATGTTVTPGRTIAVDPHVIPYGSRVYIEGYGWRTAEDCGGAVNGKHIDMAVNNHSEAMSMGVKHAGVWILVEQS